MNCDFCGREEALPFVCSYCGKAFCGDHRLPESHNCTELWMASPPSKKPEVRIPTEPAYENFTIYRPVGRERLFWFGRTELRHLLMGVALVVAVGLSFRPLLRGEPLWAIALSSLLFAAAFILHELAHKYVAQSKGLWAEFRVSMMGALLTLISIVSPFFKIIAPGAVVIAGQASLGTVGRIALAGPLTSILSATILLASSFLTTRTLSAVLATGAYVNAIIAVFNLLPFSVLDGQKIFLWDRRRWLISFLVSIVLFALAFI